MFLTVWVWMSVFLLCNEFRLCCIHSHWFQLIQGIATLSSLQDTPSDSYVSVHPYAKSCHRLFLDVCQAQHQHLNAAFLWLLTQVSWADRSVTSDFDTYYLSASGWFPVLCLMGFHSAPVGSYWTCESICLCFSWH